MLNDQVEILLVEDDPEDLDLTLRALNKADLRGHVHVARDGEEALDYLFRQSSDAQSEKQLPKLILLDLKLPKIDGLEVLQRVKRDPQTMAVPVVILTSSKMERDLVQGYSLGANSYIQKALEFHQFQAAIKELGSYWLRLNQAPPHQAVGQPLPHARSFAF